MPLVLAPSFDDHTREQVEAHLEIVRLRRIAGALEYAQGKMLKLESEDNLLGNKLIRNYDQLGKTLQRLDRELEKVEQYLNACQMIRDEMDLVHDRIELAKR
jgi:molybdenum-dependent DNA-binding transcriptional regulator ModE